MESEFETGYPWEKKPGPIYRWRVAACIVGITDVLYPVLRIAAIGIWLHSEYCEESDTEEHKTRVWLVLGIMSVLVYAPFELAGMLLLSLRLVSATYQKPKGGIDENYDAIDEADDSLNIILNWRACRIWFLGLTIMCLALAAKLNSKLLIVSTNLVFQYVMLRIVKQYVIELREFIKREEGKVKQRTIRKHSRLENAFRRASMVFQPILEE